MQYTYFPITLEALGATVRYHDLVEGIFAVGDIQVRTQYLNHPALTLGYRLEADGVSIVYACDHEPYARHLADGTGEIGEQDQRHVAFLNRADLVMHDAQYTAAEYENKIGWGHSTVSYAVEMCRIAGVKRLALTHHDPLRHDQGVDQVVRDAQSYLAGEASSLKVFAAAEGASIDLEAVGETAPRPPTEAFPAVASVEPAVLEQLILLGGADSASMNLIAEAARAENIRIRLATDAGAVLQAFALERPTLVILDESLASGDALEVCRMMRQMGGATAHELPIIIVAARENSAAGAAAGVTDWLIKPFSQQYARTRLRTWVFRSTCRWIPAPLPEAEEQRLAELYRLNILDTKPEDRFDRITRLAAAIFDAPYAFVSLIDRDRQWFKSCVGWNMKETSREVAFCSHAILNPEVMVVADTFLDSRFADHPLVIGEPYVRFYASCPLTLRDRHRVGTLCLVDTRPRQLDEAKINLLKDLGNLVQQEFSVAADS
jgi:CheY-like chemotaxis protein